MFKILFVISLTCVNAAYAQYSSDEIRYQLDKYKNKYKEIFNDDIDVDELKKLIREIESDVEDFQTEIKNNDAKEGNIAPLLQEIEQFEDFLSSGSCSTKYFTRFITDLGGTHTLVRQQNGINIKIASIGNFKVLYVYAKDVYQPRMVKISTFEKKDENSTIQGTYEFGLGDEIEVVKIIPIDSNIKITGVSVQTEGKNEPGYTSCKDEFPRAD